MEKELFAGITNDDELYFLEIETATAEHKYFSMSGFTIRPITYDDAVDRSRESLEDEELWRMAVEAGNTLKGLDDWTEEILSIDGEISQIDTPLFPNELEVDGINYVFENGSCGQHEEKTLKHYAIDKKLFDLLLKMWKKYHLNNKIKDSGSDTAIIDEAFAIKQDIDTLVIDAVKKINAEL